MRISKPKQKVRIAKWSVRLLYDKLCLCGEVYGHSDFEDGEVIITSTIVKWRMKEPGVVETRNTIYELIGGGV